MARVAVAMSGGVDSSTAAALLAEAGHEVIGLTLRLWDYGDQNLAAGRGRCCSPADIADARRVAAEVGFRHYVLDHHDRFDREVVDPFVETYAGGRTPSPCIGCNRKVKFGLLWRLARGLDADLFATGHYARLEVDAETVRLRKGLDPDKDQSYFLFDVPAAHLRQVRFPLGELDKDEVRRAARRLRLPVADKPESHELCFIPDGDKDDFVEARLPDDERQGPIRHVDGRLLGRHAGLHRFTIGQRRGLGINTGEALYVVELRDDSRTVVVGPEEALQAPGLVAGHCNWLSIGPPQGPLEAAARIRHRHREVPSTLVPLGDGRIRVEFARPQRAVAPGQGVAFYRDDLLLGGGWIERPLGAGRNAAGLRRRGEIRDLPKGDTRDAREPVAGEPREPRDRP